MKKASLILLAGGLFAMASCNEGGTTGGMTQAQVDSAVNAEVEKSKLEMAAQQDSIIAVAAQMKADSIAAVAAGKTPATAPVTRAPRPTTPSTPKAPTTTTPTNPKQDKLDRMSGNTPNKTATPEQTQEKKNKLDRMR